MLVIVLGFVFLALIVPLAALAAVARTTWAGLALAVALLACAAGWIWLIVGWAQPDEVTDTVLTLAILTPTLIIAGRLADRVAVVRPPSPARFRLVKGPRLADHRAASPARFRLVTRSHPADQPAESPGRVWLVTGRSLSGLCVGLNVLVVVVVVVGGIYLGWTYTPPSSDALPLPSALTVVSDRDEGCPGSPLDRCTREIDVRSTGGLSVDQTMQVVIGALNRLHGWRLSPYETSCRLEGWVFGRENVCVQVQTSQNAVQVVLEGGT
jgi:hypothetical protein